jgi:apolipoprotein N-acyltransferase
MGHEKMGLTGMAFSTIAFAAGAIMYWAVTTQRHGFRLSTVGVILMVVGAVGLVISTIVFAMSRRPVGSQNHSFDRQVVDAQGRTTAMHEEVH